MSIDERKCRRCGETKPISEFLHYDRSYVCIACNNTTKAKSRAEYNAIIRDINSIPRRKHKVTAKESWEHFQAHAECYLRKARKLEKDGTVDPACGR